MISRSELNNYKLVYTFDKKYQPDKTTGLLTVTEEQIKEDFIGYVVGLVGSGARSGMIINVEAPYLSKAEHIYYQLKDFRFLVRWFVAPSKTKPFDEWLPLTSLTDLKKTLEDLHATVKVLQDMYNKADAYNQP